MRWCPLLLLLPDLLLACALMPEHLEFHALSVSFWCMHLEHELWQPADANSLVQTRLMFAKAPKQEQLEAVAMLPNSQLFTQQEGRRPAGKLTLAKH